VADGDESTAVCGADGGWDFVPLRMVLSMTTPTLRPYQQQAVAEIREAYRARHRAVLFVLPTGAGKR
jgi:superfamily II DNA or RNA helicase